MREIGAGRRRNGSNLNVWRGHFDAGLIFVHPDASPTLRIERTDASTVYINFADAQATRNLYRDLSALLR
jgi:hypothetical protein